VSSTDHGDPHYVVFYTPVTPSLLGPNTPLNTLFSNTVSPHITLNVSDQDSHPYNTTYIVIFKFLDSKLEDKRLHISKNKQKQLCVSYLSLFRVYEVLFAALTIHSLLSVPGKDGNLTLSFDSSVFPTRRTWPSMVERIPVLRTERQGLYHHHHHVQKGGLGVLPVP
jgi:hypothetical protein